MTAEDVDDLTSVVLVKVLDQLERGKVIDDLETYAKAVARNAFYGHVRRRGVNLMLAPAGRQDATEDTDWLEGMGRALGLGPSPSEQVIRRDDARRYSGMIIEALARLTPLERSVLLHRFGERLSGEEVAELLGYKSAQVLYATTDRARKKLEKWISPTLWQWVHGR